MFDFFFSSRRRHTRLQGDWSSDVCSSDLLSKMARDLRLRRDVAERSVAVVPEQLIRERRVVFRMAVGPMTGRTLAAKRLALGLPGAVVHDEQIQPAVAIEIEPSGVDAPH